MIKRAFGVIMSMFVGAMFYLGLLETTGNFPVSFLVSLPIAAIVGYSFASAVIRLEGRK